MSKRCLGCMEYYGDEFEICPHCGYVEGTPAEEAIHMAPGTLLHDRYIIGRVLGFGGFGVTYIGWDGRLEQKVAVKEYLPGEFSTRMPGETTVTVFNGDKKEQFDDGLEKFVDEAKRLAKFKNEPGIVKIFDSFGENETAYIIMEYLEGETLTSRLAREHVIPEDEAVEMLTPVMQSLQVVHNEGILHRDIAPDNIFLTTDGEVKLIDFGASRYATTSHSRSLTVIIKPGFSPEEQYRSRGDQGPHTDVYALAATMYKMITGKTPPDAMERRASIESKKKELLIPPHKIDKSISLNRENAILNAMNVRIEDRTPDVRTFMEELNADPPAKRVYGKIKKIDLYRWPLWLKILIPSLLSLILVIGILLATGVIKLGSLFSGEVEVPDGVVVVPDVEGMEKDEAIRTIEEMKLQVSAKGSVVSDYVQAGRIVLQSPNSGSYIDEYGTVMLTVSSGRGVQAAKDGKSIVPYVIWDTKEDAVSKLLQAGLAEPDIEEKNDENVEAGKVISQSVEYGTEVDEGTKITLVISLGPASFDMPDVTGKDADEAKSALSSKGLSVTVSYASSNSVGKGKVISQSVESGKSVKKGDSVKLTVSSGGSSTVTVPDVVGKTKGSAVSTLEDAGFKTDSVENYNSSVEKGNVISQSPSAGTSQEKGTTITLYISKGAEPAEPASSKTSSSSSSSDNNQSSASSKTTKITVYFDGNGGTVSQNSKNVTSSYGNLPTATRSNYEFAGWYSSRSGGERVYDNSSLISSVNHTLYAHWNANVSIGSLSGCTLYRGCYKNYSASFSPSNASISWSSSNSSIASVSSSGTVTAKEIGSATITATASFGGKSDSTSFTVIVRNISVSLSSLQQSTSFDARSDNRVIANNRLCYKMPNPTVSHNVSSSYFGDRSYSSPSVSADVVGGSGFVYGSKLYATQPGRLQVIYRISVAGYTYNSVIYTCDFTLTRTNPDQGQYIRSSPSKSSAQLGYVPRNTTYTITEVTVVGPIGVSGTEVWGYTYYGGTSGWTLIEYWS